jgi:hypothetical protein
MQSREENKCPIFTTHFRRFDVKNCYGRTESVSKLLEEFKWEPLRVRRLRARHSLIKKLGTERRHGKYNIDATLHF